MKPIPAHYDRTVEPCHRQVSAGRCAELPIPFDEFLHKRNREADTVELSSVQHDLPEKLRKPEPEEPERTPTKIEPEPIHEETVRKVEISYEIPSDLMTGRLIDLLL
ncbi:MAG: hypothetical protein ACIARQ_02385 [Phycisphaerales bacterium JB061]